MPLLLVLQLNNYARSSIPLSPTLLKVANALLCSPSPLSTTYPPSVKD